ncbi:MAG: glycosyltransferase family 2 protein [Chloroflexota bacterium]
MINVSVVVCTYTESRWDYLETAAGSLQRQNTRPLEIIVVVDHNPKLMERVQANFPDIVVVENQQERGLSGARNSGIAAAQGAVIAFLDDDAIATPDWIEQLCVAYSDSNVVGVGGMIEPFWQGGRPAWFPTEFDWVVGCTYRGMPETAAPVRNLIGANMSFRRKVFDELGTFRLGYGCDETDFCIRVRQRWPEKVLLYRPAAKVIHQVPASRANWGYFRSRCYFEGGSKAVVSWLVGAQDGLSSERAYTFRTLPLGIIRGLKDTLLKRRQAGLERAGAIIAGLAITTSGYLMGKIFVREAARHRGWKAV